MIKSKIATGVILSAVIFLLLCGATWAAGEVLSGDAMTERPLPDPTPPREFSNEAPYITNGHMTSGMKNGKPLDRVLAFFPGSPAFYAAAELRSAPVGTRVRFSWTFVTENQLIDEVVITIDREAPDVYVYSNLINNAGDPWPRGIFGVKIYIEDRAKPEQVIYFEVE